MDKQPDPKEWISQLPNWVKGVIAFVTAIIVFITLLLNNIYLSITVFVGLILITTLCLSIYAAFTYVDSPLVKGRRIPRYPQYRRWALALIFIIPFVTGLLLINETSRSFARIAFVGTATPTPTATMTVTPSPTTTSTPTATDTPRATSTPIPPTPTTSPMPETGFNIAIAQFTTLSSSDDSLMSSSESKELSEWLFNTLSKRVDGLPPSYRVPLRGPSEVEPIIGQKITDRNTYAAQVAKKHNATLLIYGQVVQTAENVYLVQPEFFVSAEGFRYGDEIIGPNLLGKPVQFLPPLARDDLLQDINEKLDIRVEVLSFIVEGLVAYYIGHHDEAYGKFEEALNLPNWQSDEGQEVVHLLMGAAKLRKYGNLIGLDPDRPPDSFVEAQQVLKEAEDHFREARRLNRTYARSYLGLAAVANYEATIFELRQAHLAEVDLERLQDAKYWYSEALNDEADQSPSAYVRVKAAYGLGQVYLVEYIWYRRNEAAAQANEAREKAHTFFKDVLIAYNETGRASNLAFMAGTTRAQLALLAGFEGQYENVIAECDEAIVILETLEADAPFDYIAHCHYWMALAYENQAVPNLDAARRHYEQAIKIGKDSQLIAKEDLDKWEAARDRLN